MSFPPPSVALDADGSNIFYSCIPILDKSMHLRCWRGEDRSSSPFGSEASRHVVMIQRDGAGGGLLLLFCGGVTLDGNVGQYQYASTPHDGEGLIPAGSDRNGVYRDLN